jgi:CheY-like chemotaxis protein
VTRRYGETLPKAVGKPPGKSLPVAARKERKKGDKSTMEWNNKSVLVVDDDRDLRYLLSVRLVSAGYMVYGAANGLEALEQMEKHSVDVVLTDYRMPKMDGFEFLSVCRVKWPGTPVVVFSAERDDLAHEAVERGAFAWIRKGSEFTMLLEFLAYAIQQSVHV